MDNYRCQDSCSNCKHVHIHADYDIIEYYCTLNCPLPKAFKNPFIKGFADAEKWCWKVDACGICDSFEKEKVNS